MEHKYVFLGSDIRLNIHETETELGDRTYASSVAGYVYEKSSLIRYESDTTKGKKYLSITHGVCNGTTADGVFETILSTDTLTNASTDSIYTQATSPQESVIGWVERATVSGTIIDILSDDRGTLIRKMPTFLGNGESFGSRVYRRDDTSVFTPADSGIIASGSGGKVVYPKITDLEATL